MQLLYTDTYIDIQKEDKQNFLEVIQKQHIDDATVFYALSEKIIQATNQYHCTSIIIVVNNITYYPDTRYIQETYLPGLGKQGIQYLAAVISEDEQVKSFHKELDNSLRQVKQQYGIQLRFFANITDAREWVNTQSKKSITTHEIRKIPVELS